MSALARIAVLERELETMLGIQAGLYAAIASLIAKHPDHEQLVLHLTSVTEIADAGALGAALTPRQREVARTVLEALQQIAAARGEIRPLDR